MISKEIERFILNERFLLRFSGRIPEKRWRELIAARFIKRFFRKGKADAQDFNDAWARLEQAGVLK